MAANFNRAKRSIALILVILTALLSFNYVTVFADEIWDNMKLATQYVNEKNYTEAVKYWINLVKIYESVPEKMDKKNYAMYLEKIGDYYAGEYGNKDINRPLAVEYYDKSHEAYKKTDLSWGPIQAKNKADKLRTVIRVFYEKTSSQNTSNVSGSNKYIPQHGTYIGMYGEFDSRLIDGGYVSPVNFQNTFDKNPAMLLVYSTWGVSEFPTGQTDLLKDSGSGIQIAMQPSSGLDSVADGDYIRNWAKAAKESGVPVFLRFGGEMNGEWVVWGLDPKKYIEKFRLVHNIMEEEASNVVMLWAPNDIPYDNMEQYYPGDEYVDWVGVSSYAVPDGNGHKDLSNYDMNPLNKLQHIYKMFKDKKPIMIAEGATAYWAKNFPNEDFSKWYENNMKKTYYYLPRLYPQIKAITYFNREEDFNNYDLEANPKANEVYKKLIANPYYLSKIGDTSQVYYDELDGDVLEKGKIVFSCYSSIYDPFIGKVEYYLDDKLISTSKDIPYNFEYDFSQFIKPDPVLKVKVYDSKNVLTGEKEFNLKIKSSDKDMIVLKINDPHMESNGNKVEIDPGRGTSPTIINSRTLVPIRALIEEMGGTLIWEDTEKKMTIMYKDEVIQLWVGQKKTMVNGTEIISDSPPTVKNGRTLLPVRFITENLGAGVYWDQKNQKIYIEY